MRGRGVRGPRAGGGVGHALTWRVALVLAGNRDDPQAWSDVWPDRSSGTRMNPSSRRDIGYPVVWPPISTISPSLHPYLASDSALTARASSGSRSSATSRAVFEPPAPTRTWTIDAWMFRTQFAGSPCSAMM